MATDLRTAEPALATRMHLALAGVYLDRTRASDGLRELTAAGQLDQTRADVPLFEALVQSQLAGNEAAATPAFRRASALNPDDPVTAYVLARHLTRVGADEEASQSYQRFTNPRSVSTQQALTAPFVHLGLFQGNGGRRAVLPASHLRRRLRGAAARQLRASDRGIPACERERSACH
jgi:Tfp pilus assembly protein PilF